ncbi:MAG: EAL domain-containing protein [Timaviella obliquedivisa GSE-PSE-MK23-08B]|jgi:diguanylate cyclase (GGDEF)-like protein|nr:EAL domain-containing protein [Timaviella obliquedivisa GSE-PSE-MK23-08B]
MNCESTLNHSLSVAVQTDILIVDDVLENIRLLSAMLDCNGYQTRKATNGAMALTAVETTLPSLILLDIRMPNMSGYQVCQRLKSDPRTAHIPIIFLSAADDITNKIEAFKVGGADYITKPFHIEEVLARIQNQLAMIAAQQTICQLNAQLEGRVQERTQQLETANSQLSKLAFRDPLTWLPNRALFMERLHEALSQQQASSENQFAVFYLDCDRFKPVNDSLGHQAGDELLIAISERLNSLLRQEDCLARLGGDEFVILLGKLEDSRYATQVADRIIKSFDLPFHLRGKDIFVSFSIGIVLECSSYWDPEELLRDADTAMYQAKALGKDQYQIFEPSMYQAVCHRLQIETDLRQAIQRQELALYYQPIVELATGNIVGVEALIRWHHPIQGLIPPDRFIPIAEETGFILKLGHWALREACGHLRYWQDQCIVASSFSVSVNVSACQFAQPDFVKQLDEILAETQLAPQCLKLEITETVIMQDIPLVADNISNLQERSIQLSIDDFGTGYSSLSYLHSFSVENLKIDRSFINRLHKKKSNFGLVTAIVQIGKAMKMNLIAEGIETSEQLAHLKFLGCQFGQGYLFSKPLPSEEMIVLLSTTHQKHLEASE